MPREVPVPVPSQVWTASAWLIAIAQRLGRPPNDRCTCGYSNLACDVTPYYHPDRVKARLARSGPVVAALPVSVVEERLEALRAMGLDPTMISKMWPEKSKAEALAAWRGLAFAGGVLACPAPVRHSKAARKRSLEAWLKTRDDRFFHRPARVERVADQEATA